MFRYNIVLGQHREILISSFCPSAPLHVGETLEICHTPDVNNINGEYQVQEIIHRSFNGPTTSIARVWKRP